MHNALNVHFDINPVYNRNSCCFILYVITGFTLGLRLFFLYSN
ncbi:hypothetical protein BN136_3539 [Cronobacter universalis NCTC 9529]|nr:hypothetical protein BN136_3539 [Cronobacter universalis NCTC 9529]